MSWLSIIMPAEMSRLSALEWTTVATVVVMIIHLAAPWIQEKSKGHAGTIGSFGIGMAVSYLFLHLIAELERIEDEAAEWFSDGQHLLLLAGFLCYYGIEHLAVRHRAAGNLAQSQSLHFSINITGRCLYTWLLVFALPENIQEDNLRALPALVAVSLHLLHDDMELAEEFGAHFRQIGRYLLAGTAALACLCDYYYFADSVTASGILTAWLAGSVLYRTLGSRLLQQHQAVFRWFLLGVGMFVLLHLMTA